MALAEAANAHPVVPCAEVVAIARRVLDGDVSLAVSKFRDNAPHPGLDVKAYPLSAVMKTNATSLPLAAFAAPVRSVSVSEDVTVVPSLFARAVIASMGWWMLG